MGYFSNGTEGMIYQEEYCVNCIHDINEDCPIWLLHLQYSYELCNAPNNFLDELIPRSHDGLCNEKGKVHSLPRVPNMRERPDERPTRCVHGLPCISGTRCQKCFDEGR